MNSKIRYCLFTLAISASLFSCSDFFDSIPGKQFGESDTFSSKVTTEEYLNNVYSYIREVADCIHPDENGGIFTEASLEGGNRWDKTYAEWTNGSFNQASGHAKEYFGKFYQAIAKASTFIQNVDQCKEATASMRGKWKAEARALRAYFYFELLRIYGPVPLIGDKPIPLDAPMSDLLRERNSVDECVDYIVSELNAAVESGDLPQRAGKGQLGRIDVATCKALIAKTELYWASALFNGNTDYASLKNKDGKQLFPQTYDQTKWEKARDAYADFMNFSGAQGYKLAKVYDKDGNYDPYASCRAVADWYTSDWEAFDELIFVKLRSAADYTYWTCPKFTTFQDMNLTPWGSGGGGYYTSQEMVDMFFDKEGKPIQPSATGKPTEGDFVPQERYYDPNDKTQSRLYYNTETHQENGSDVRSYVLKEWRDREPRFYVNITFNGSNWINPGQYNEEMRTDFTNGKNGTCGRSKASGDCPDSGYLIRKGAKSESDNGSNHFSPILRMGDMILGYSESLCECGQLDEALAQLNLIRNRAGIPLYAFGGGMGKIDCPKTKEDLMNRIRRERLVELAFEWNRFFDVRRWKVAEGNNDPDHWIYPAYHTGGEGGDVHGMNMDKDYPEFFYRTVFEKRVSFSKKQYFMPIPYDDIRRVPQLVQNLGWDNK